jgi:hypothetical protein
MGDVERILVEERERLHKDLQVREDWDEAHIHECRQAILSYYEDDMF